MAERSCWGWRVKWGMQMAEDIGAAVKMRTEGQSRKDTVTGS